MVIRRCRNHANSKSGGISSSTYSKGLNRVLQQNNIQLEAWSPLMRGKVFEIELLQDIARKYGKQYLKSF